MLNPGSAHPQRISVSGLELSVGNRALELCATVEARGLEVRTATGYRLEFSIEDGRRRVLLPGIEYTGGLRGRYEQRREILSDIPDTAPYESFRGVKRGKTYTTDYKLSMPFDPWMTDAAIRYRLYRYGSGGSRLVASGTMDALERRDTLGPDPQLCHAMTDYVVPERSTKRRRAALSLDVAFPAISSAELDGFMSAYAPAGHHVKIERLHITAYGSPYGKFDDNDRFARSRAEAVGHYVRTAYPLAGTEVHLSWVAEDWDGLIEAVETSTRVPDREQLLDTIVDALDSEPDTRERLVESVGDGRSYSYLRDNIYPALRRTELTADYRLPEFNDIQAKELLPAHPDLLSPLEIFRVAMLYAEGSDERRCTLETAARQYPEDFASNGNMAVFLLRAGDADSALPYLQKIADNSGALTSIGAYYYIAGDRESAAEYFEKAVRAGIAKGGENMRLMNNTN